MGLSLQFPIHVNISSAFVLAEITCVFMSLQDQAIQKLNMMGDSSQNLAAWHCEELFWVSAFCCRASCFKPQSALLGVSR